MMAEFSPIDVLTHQVLVYQVYLPVV